MWRQQDVLPVQLRGHAHQARLQLVLHRAEPGRTRRPLLDDDHRSADRPAVPEQHDSAVALLAARAAGAAEQLVPGAEHAPRRRATTSSSARCRRTRTSTRSASITRSASTARSSAAITKTTYANRTASNLIAIGDRVFEQDTKNWQVSHSWAIEVEPRQPVPRRPGRGARRPERASRARRPTWTSSAARASSPTCPTPSASVRASACRLRRHRRRGQRLHGQQPADVGHQQHDDVGRGHATR